MLVMSLRVMSDVIEGIMSVRYVCTLERVVVISSSASAVIPEKLNWWLKQEGSAEIVHVPGEIVSRTWWLDKLVIAEGGKKKLTG
jgi:hypothetical protein